MFYVHASTYLVDATVRNLATWEAIVISVAGLALAWLVYDGLCRTFPNDEGILAVLVFAFICVSAWGAGELFAAQASYIQVGAMIGTMMVGNVFFVIIPAQRELVRAKKDGRATRSEPGEARQDAVGAQQLPDAAGRLRDALGSLRVHLRAHPRAGLCWSR